jgi:hypothetical protein
MSTETHQAELLARWLSESPDGGVRPEPPRGLDADVVDAVSALRPDRAPAPRLDIDDILFEVADGPLAEAVDPAAVGALGALLDEGDLFDALDPDVLDAVSVLRPDRAPAPRVSIDDILAEVKTGPLAAGGAATGPAEVLPPSVPETAEALPAPANTERPRGRMPGWLWPSLGGIAVAATALLFVAPMATTTMDAPPVSTAPARFADEAEPAPAAMPAAQAPMEEAELEEARAATEPMRPRGGEPGGGSAGPAPLQRGEPQLAATKDLAKRDLADGGAVAAGDATGQLESLGYVDGATATATSAPAAGATRAGAGSAPAGSAEVLDATTGSGDAYAFGVGGLMGGADVPPADAAPLTQDAEFAGAGPEQDKRLDEAPAEGRAAAPSPDPEPAPARRRNQAADDKPAEPSADRGGAERSNDRSDADLDDAIAYEEAEDMAVVTETVASRGGGGRKSSKPRLAPRKSKRAEAPAAPAAAEAPPPPAPSSGEDLSSLRAEAWPLTAPPSTRSAAPEAWAAVDRAQAAGDTAGTVAALETLLRGADDAMAQEAAWELARHHLRQGRRDLALVSVARGLERPGGHPVARSRLLALQGEILEQRGDTGGAAESYRRAIQAR